MNTFYFSQYRSLHENWPNTEYFLVRIFLYSVWIKKNTDQKRLRIWTLFMQLVIQQRVPSSYLHGTPGNLFYIVWKGGKLPWDLICQELPAKGKTFLQCWVSLTVWASVTKFTLEMNMKCQNIAATTEAKQVVCTTFFKKMSIMFIQCIIIDVYWQSFFRPWQNCD